ncbi:phosphatidate cytidylyltransferase [Spiroplasma tabanidicola]|uniref:Phosphatidate cytidylyltransferase n=1 Tax=Spiroplasma tabanidicola TaxID=324079 RepID=A0A6I6C928_9MOLU|nr:phosphatidate cytidylyltransferase [Spiroplasma tabanidicola]QGS52116.1 phosphatidate cytidylyltransferase [Spiroplasma tabanidicola]
MIDKSEVTDSNVEDKNDNNNLELERSIKHFKTKKGKETFKTRLISSVFLLIFLVFYITTGSIYTYFTREKYFDIFSFISIGLTILICGIACFEINKAAGYKKWWQQLILITVALVLYIFPITPKLYTFSPYTRMDLYSWLKGWHFTLVLSISSLFYLFLALIENKRVELKKVLIGFSFMAMIVIAMKTYSIVSLDLLEANMPIFSFNTIVWIWLMVILGDSFAYIGGMMFGKTKLAPKISPNKTWEGATIGSSVASVIGIAYAAIFYFVPALDNFKPLNIGISLINNKVVEFFIYVLLSCVFPIIALMGDLIFSWVKRVFDIKDYSRLIPGHGGILDRLDSIIFSLFVLFFIVLAIGS